MTILGTSMRYGHHAFNKSGVPDLNPELFHNIAMYLSEYAEKSDGILDQIREATHVPGQEKLGVTIGGDLEFENPVGFAAGFCKEPTGLLFWEAFNAGYITIGGVTPKPQSGNQKPRIYRVNNGLVNAMGFNSKGLDENIRQMEERKAMNMMPNCPLGFSLTNNVDTEPEDKIGEFKLEMEKTYGLYEYYVVNIGCPNQTGVIDLQHDLDNILKEVTEYNDILALRHGIKRKKIFLKIPPLTQNPDNPKDLTSEQLKSIAETCNKYKDKGLVAVVATNTTKEHDHSEIKILSQDGTVFNGGGSGKQIQEASRNTVSEVKKYLDEEIEIIGVGGIGYDEKGSEGQSGVDMLNAGAKSIKLLSSFVQNNVMVFSDIIKAILEEKQRKQAIQNIVGK